MLLCVSLMACLFVSCKNEDIAVSRDVTLNVNPYSIVAGFARHEINVGDLANFGCSSNPDYYKLRTCLLVYGKNGDLIESISSDLNNYNDSMTDTITLSDGEYTVVAIAYIVDIHNGVPCWNVLEMNRLDALKIVNNEELNNLWFKILGVGSRIVDVGVGENVFDITMKPAGSLLINNFKSVHYFSDYVRYQMFTDKTPTKITFDANGSCVASYNTSSDLSYQASFSLITDGYEQDNVYWYSFLFPMGATRFEWHAWDSGGGSHVMGGWKSANIGEGKVYMSTIDLKTTFDITELDN